MKLDKKNYVVIVIVAIVILIIIFRAQILGFIKRMLDKLGSSGTSVSRTSCGCTSDSQCGRDQYCDGCVCHSVDINRVVVMQTPVIKKGIVTEVVPPRPIPTGQIK